MFGFYLLAIWTLCYKFHYVLLQAFPPKHFPKVMVYLCPTRMKRVTGSKSFLKDPFPQTIYIGNTQPSLLYEDTIPPKENASLCLPITDFFISMNGLSMCYLDFISTTKDDSNLWWTINQPFRDLQIKHPIWLTYEHLLLGISLITLHETH